MNLWLRGLAKLLGSAALAFGLVLALGWPGESQAEGSERQLAAQGRIRQDEAMIQDLVFATRILPHSTGSGRCLLEATTTNPAERPVEGARVELSVTRTVSSPMARVMPMPQVVWREERVLNVEAGELVRLRRELAPELCAEMAKQPTPTRGEAAQPSRRVSFRATARALIAERRKPQAPERPSATTRHARLEPQRKQLRLAGR